MTGLAGVLTGIVGLLGLAFNQGWLGESTPEEGGAATTATEEEIVRIRVDPEELSLNQPGAAQDTVTVTNNGNRSIVVSTTLSGPGEGSFDVDDGDCTRSRIPSGANCEIDVVLDAGPGRHEARLVVSANDVQEQDVELTGNSVGLLG